MAQAGEPFGYLTINGQAPDMKTLAKLVGETETETGRLVGELEKNHVFSRNRQGVIYSRKMVRMAKKSAHAVKVGRLGGNPKLLKQTQNPPQDNQEDKGENADKHKDNIEVNHADKAADKTLEARSYKLESKEEPPLTPHQYVFEGKVIKLTGFELERWQRAYKNIPNIIGELTNCDDWLVGKGVGGNRDAWFARASTWLRRSDSEHAAKSPGVHVSRNPQAKDLSYE